jgi:hypothetical protein
LASRKTGLSPRREPNGRLSRSTEDIVEPVSPAQARRMRDAAALGVIGPEWGSTIGRLFVVGKISATEFEAGRRWGLFMAEYLRLIGAPPPHEPPGPIATLGEAHGRGDREDPPIDSKAGRRLKEHRDRIVDEMDRALLVLGPADIAAAFRLTVERDQHPVGTIGLANLRHALTRLAAHWKVSR